jgi:hypothetical protein
MIKNRTRFKNQKKESKIIPSKTKELLFNKKDKIKDKGKKQKKTDNKTDKNKYISEKKDNLKKKNDKNKIIKGNHKVIISSLSDLKVENINNNNDKNVKIKNTSTRKQIIDTNKSINIQPGIIRSNLDDNNKILSQNKNLVLKVTNSSQNRSKNASNEKLLFVDNFSKTKVGKTKETISTNLETISIEKDQKEENLEDIKNALKAVFTPIPTLEKKNTKTLSGQQPNLKDVEKAIKLRRQQYNEYIKSLLKKPKHKPKPKIYDLNSVIFIQKMFKAYLVKNIEQKVTRLKINLCVTELFCLIFNHIFRHARRRITFYYFKNYYHDPFTHIFTEVNFSDKLSMKLSDNYYNFNNFFKRKRLFSLQNI